MMSSQPQRCSFHICTSSPGERDCRNVSGSTTSGWYEAIAGGTSLDVAASLSSVSLSLGSFASCFAGTFPGNLTGVFFPSLETETASATFSERGARVRVAARVFREVAAHERSDFGQVVVVVHHELQENARLVRAVRERNPRRPRLGAGTARSRRTRSRDRAPPSRERRCLGAPDGVSHSSKTAGTTTRGGPGLFGATFGGFRDFAALRLHGARKRRARVRLECVGGGGGGARPSPTGATAFSSSKTPMCSLKVVAVSASTACAGPMLLKGTTAAATMQATRMPEAAA